jgi:hypothetical protein
MDFGVLFFKDSPYSFAGLELSKQYGNSEVHQGRIISMTGEARQTRVFTYVLTGGK